MSKAARTLLGMLVFGVLGTVVAAEGDPTRRADRLEPLFLNAATGFSVSHYELRTGVYYRWRIESDGLEEYRLLAPALFRESWIDQVVIEDKEVKPFGLYAVEFDDEGVIDVWFIPQRPGEYTFYVEGLENQGFSGVFVVK
ncbi:hypothetical protein C8D95_101883 [Silicimonas algicola]|uniref:Copper-binding protein n=2 Tax=Silicimonas algicola TaxID=1826607 RepID=A0A316GDL4_9RHOB|nr:hypothetical protein [Silicimonas algicola]PWK59061.1 hypothetical protein C8D95_101883 [Silicimonas algicola]